LDLHHISSTRPVYVRHQHNIFLFAIIEGIKLNPILKY